MRWTTTMAIWPATSAKSSQPSLPCAILPRLAIHSIFFRRTLHHFDTEYFQRAAAATVLADHADNWNGKHEDIKGKVACFGGKAVGGRTFGCIEQGPNNAHDNHQQRDETDGFVHAEECADPFFAVINGPDGDGGQDADETEYGQLVQCARDGIVGLGTCSGHNVSLFLIYLIF